VCVCGCRRTDRCWRATIGARPLAFCTSRDCLITSINTPGLSACLPASLSPSLYVRLFAVLSTALLALRKKVIGYFLVTFDISANYRRWKKIIETRKRHKLMKVNDVVCTKEITPNNAYWTKITVCHTCKL